MEGWSVNSLICEWCSATEGVIRYHQNTQYVDKERNWVTLCPECRVENDENWREQWRDYWNSVL